MAITSPFKFLDAYTKNDKDIFFGRDEEIEQLYSLVFQSNLTLVYGQSGTGKTSLVQCGLANRFAQSDWFPINLRRNENINQSLLQSLQKFAEVGDRGSTLAERLAAKRASASKGPAVKVKAEAPLENEVVRALRGMSKHYLKPLFLIFDQFEELFILGDKAEQTQFYENIAQIMETEAYCRVIFIMREESIAQLSDFEKVIPFLFEKRLRVEPMSRLKTEEVVSQTCAKFDIAMESERIPLEIVNVLGEGKARVELTYLQVFLDQLYQEAAEKNPDKITFDSQLIRTVGSIEDVLGDFLDRQTRNIQEKLGAVYPDVPQSSVSKILNAFVSLEGTKRPMAKGAVKVSNLSPEQAGFLIDEFEKGRILRFDNDLYELSHDTLAARIASQRGADEVALLQIAKIVKDRYQVSAATKAVLNANELQLINNYRRRLEEEGLISPEEWGFVRKSTAANRRRLIFIGAAVAVLITTLTVFSIVSNKLRMDAQVSEAKALFALKQTEEAQKKERAAKYNEYLNLGKAAMASSDYLGAIDAFKAAFDFNPEGVEALDSLRSAESKADISVLFEQLIQDGDVLYEKGPGFYLDALAKFQKALVLNYNRSLAQSKVNNVQGKLAGAFEDFKRAGDTFFNADGYEEALSMYQQALRIKPDDPYISRRVTECLEKKNG
jgi:tetratricopeptide (TPR) repeat protein